jgi:hypothetical protein
VKTSSNAGTGQRLLLGVLCANGHETGHLILSQINLATTEGREADVSDLELVGGSRHVGGMCMEVEKVGGGGVKKRGRKEEGE